MDRTERHTLADDVVLGIVHTCDDAIAPQALGEIVEEVNLTGHRVGGLQAFGDEWACKEWPAGNEASSPVGRSSAPGQCRAATVAGTGTRP